MRSILVSKNIGNPDDARSLGCRSYRSFLGPIADVTVKGIADALRRVSHTSRPDDIFVYEVNPASNEGQRAHAYSFISYVGQSKRENTKFVPVMPVEFYLEGNAADTVNNSADFVILTPCDKKQAIESLDSFLRLRSGHYRLALKFTDPTRKLCDLVVNILKTDPKYQCLTSLSPNMNYLSDGNIYQLQYVPLFTTVSNNLLMTSVKKHDFKELWPVFMYQFAEELKAGIKKDVSLILSR